MIRASVELSRGLLCFYKHFAFWGFEPKYKSRVVQNENQFNLHKAVENDLPCSHANQINCVLTGTETCSKAESEFVKNECVNGIHSIKTLPSFVYRTMASCTTTLGDGALGALLEGGGGICGLEKAKVPSSRSLEYIFQAS